MRSRLECNLFDIRSEQLVPIEPQAMHGLWLSSLEGSYPRWMPNRTISASEASVIAATLSLAFARHSYISDVSKFALASK